MTNLDRQIAAIERNTKHDPDALGKLRRAIIDNTRGEELFWLGECLLGVLEQETGFKG